MRRALSTGYVATLLDGRKRFFIGGVDQTAMPNMEIQGTAASIANRALIRINKECGHRAWSPRSGPMAQVHDWIGLVVPKARAREAEDILNRHMPYTITNGDVSLDCTIEQKTAETWDET